ncbi:MAG: hypothetical protein RL701_4432 [Pseudomonadota bacterium]
MWVSATTFAQRVRELQLPDERARKDKAGAASCDYRKLENLCEVDVARCFYDNMIL